MFEGRDKNPKTDGCLGCARMEVYSSAGFWKGAFPCLYTVCMPLLVDEVDGQGWGYRCQGGLHWGEVMRLWESALTRAPTSVSSACCAEKGQPDSPVLNSMCTY